MHFCLFTVIEDFLSTSSLVSVALVFFQSSFCCFFFWRWKFMFQNMPKLSSVLEANVTYLLSISTTTVVINMCIVNVITCFILYFCFIYMRNHVWTCNSSLFLNARLCCWLRINSLSFVNCCNVYLQYSVRNGVFSCQYQYSCLPWMTRLLNDYCVLSRSFAQGICECSVEMQYLECVVCLENAPKLQNCMPVYKEWFGLCSP